MDRTEKLRLSADTEFGYSFRQGIFSRFYEQSLFWFSVNIKPLKPMREKVKGGEFILYGGMPITSFEKLLGVNALLQVEYTEYGWRWPYAAQNGLFDETRYTSWREQIPAVPETVDAPKSSNIIDSILSFNLAGSTPIEAMQAIQQWQMDIRRQKEAG
jgi:hypothetical protein